MPIQVSKLSTIAAPIRDVVQKLQLTIINVARRKHPSAMWAYLRHRDSALATKLLGKLPGGVEIGGSAHNSFRLDVINVDRYASATTVYKRREIKESGMVQQVDVVAPGDSLPFDSNSKPFVLSSHVLEHFYDPIGALKEWYRVVKPGGYVFMIVPHKNRTFDRHRPRTSLRELLARHEGRDQLKETERQKDGSPVDKHWSVWVTEDVIELINHLGYPIAHVQDIDDKQGNGFTVVIQKPNR